MEKYLDKNLPIKKRVDDLISKMTLDEKLEQMHCYGCVYTMEEQEEFMKKGINMIHSEYYSFKGFDFSFNNRLQKFMKEKTRLGIPAYIATECVHGAPTPYTTIFPTNGCLAATFDLELAKKEAHFAAKEIRAMGFNRVYSPNVDLLRDPRWGRCGEDYGEDPYLNGKFGAEMVKGFQEEGVEATIKHYLAYSTPEGGLNLGTAHLGEREIREYFIPPFAECIKAGAMGVMNCYNEIDGVPGGINPFWTQKVLREELGFEGDFITDYGLSNVVWNLHQACNKDEKILGKLYINAGVDIEACGAFAYGEHFKKMVLDKEVDIKLVDNAVRRVLTNKFKLGLFDNPYYDESKIKDIVATKEAFDLTYEIAAKGTVLLKNDGILPLKKNAKILLVGPNSMLAQLGGITYYPIVDEGKYKDICISSKAIKTHEAMINKFGKDNVKVLPCCNFSSIKQDQLDEAVKIAKDWADVIIFAGGNNSVGYSGGENGGANNPINMPDAVTSNEGYDTDDIGMSPSQKKTFAAFRSLHKPIVFLIYDGKPMEVTNEIEDINALMFCFGPGVLGNNAIMDILAGDVNPSGKLTFTIPRNVGQIPVYYNRKPLRGLYNNEGSLTHGGQDYVFNSKQPLFNFGDGLSYTKFTYSNLKVKKDKDKICVSVDVKNTGKFDGDESVLVYTRSLSNVLVTPEIKKLRSFKRIHLKKGESKNVNFVLTNDDFSYVGYDMKPTLPLGKVSVIIDKFEKEFNL